jgi:hypothetical protein
LTTKAPYKDEGSFPSGSPLVLSEVEGHHGRSMSSRPSALRRHDG